MQEFQDKVAVVTSAASGIGRALAERFAAEGMKVVLADVEVDALARAEAELQARGARVLAVRTDVRQASDVEALAERTLAAFGGVHVVSAMEQVDPGSDGRHAGRAQSDGASCLTTNSSAAWTQGPQKLAERTTVLPGPCCLLSRSPASANPAHSAAQYLIL
jgi:NAD(P)-dependent dehydrogenase (short-subunit alcohol dehydrogenase family)